MAKRPVYDWSKLKAEFASGEESLTAFAKERGLALSHLKERARVDLWEEARRAFRSDVQRQANDQKAAFRARSEADIDNRAHTIADTTTALIQKRLKRLMDAEGTDDEDGDDEPKGKGKGKGRKRKSANALEIKLLTDALNNAYELQRVTAGLPKQKVPEKIQVEASLEIATGVMELPQLKGR